MTKAKEMLNHLELDAVNAMRVYCIGFERIVMIKYLILILRVVFIIKNNEYYSSVFLLRWCPLVHNNL